MKSEKQEYWIKESIKDKPFEDTYTITKELGSGATSKVFKCIHKGTGQAWAAKIINKKIDSKIVETETGILLKIKHDNVIRMKEIYEIPDQIILVLELVTGGELFERIVSRGHYCEKDAAYAVKEMLTAVKHLHENGIIHRDLKPENLLYQNLSPDAKLKLADFGLSKMIEPQMKINTICGTPGYCAPEVVRGHCYDHSVDMWSIGVIAYILLCGYEPFYDDDERLMYKKIIKGDYEFDSPYWDNITENAKDFIRKLLTVDPKKRLTASRALEHKWVKGSAASGEHMEDAQTNIKKFNARRKMKNAQYNPDIGPFFVPPNEDIAEEEGIVEENELQMEELVPQIPETVEPQIETDEPEKGGMETENTEPEQLQEENDTTDQQEAETDEKNDAVEDKANENEQMEGQDDGVVNDAVPEVAENEDLSQKEAEKEAVPEAFGQPEM